MSPRAGIPCSRCPTGSLRWDDGEWACLQCGDRPRSDLEAHQAEQWLARVAEVGARHAQGRRIDGRRSA